MPRAAPDASLAFSVPALWKSLFRRAVFGEILLYTNDFETLVQNAARNFAQISIALTQWAADGLWMRQWEHALVLEVVFLQFPVQRRAPNA